MDEDKSLVLPGVLRLLKEPALFSVTIVGFAKGALYRVPSFTIESSLSYLWRV